jgi:hypothetical protein
VTLRRAGTPRTRGAGQASVSTAAVQPASIAWWMSLADLESWIVGWLGVSPDPASGQVHETSLDMWLFAQVNLHESRRSELLRLLSSMRWGSGGRGGGPVP